MTATAERAARAAVIRACRRMDARGLVAGAEGNISARFGSGRIVITPAGATKADLRGVDLVVVRLQDDATTGATTAPSRAKGRRAVGALRPSTELAMHLAIYLARPDVGAIVHAHPPAATGFAVARRPMPVGALAELAGVIGPVPLVPYRMPGSDALATAVARKMTSANVVLLANHGAVAVASTCVAAANLMESLEQSARILVTAHILGGVTELGHSDVIALERARTDGAHRTAR